MPSVALKQSFKDAGGNLMFSEEQIEVPEKKKDELKDEENDDEECEGSLLHDALNNDEDGNDYSDLYDDDDLLADEERNSCCTRISDKIVEYLMIEPTNKRLGAFHFLLSISFYTDIFITSLCIANYDFRNGNDNEFLNHPISFGFVFVVQALEIILSFF